MRTILRKVWEVYEKDTQKCIAFSTEEQAENQTVFNTVECFGWSNVYLTEEENKTLDDGGFIWCD